MTSNKKEFTFNNDIIGEIHIRAIPNVLLRQKISDINSILHSLPGYKDNINDQIILNEMLNLSRKDHPSNNTYQL